MQHNSTTTLPPEQNSEEALASRRRRLRFRASHRPDPDLTDWLFGRLPLPPERETPMLRRMVDACRAKGVGIAG